MINQKTSKIICTAFAEDSTHDFKLYERCIGSAVSADKKIQADKGYQGIVTLHRNSETPKKQLKGGHLTEAGQEENGRISRECIGIEHMHAKIKVFKISSSKYRNRHKRCGLRITLICGMINFEYLN